MRVFLAFVHMKPSKKLKILIYSQIVASLAIIFLVEVLGIIKFAAYFASVTYGLSLSALFGLFFVLPSEFNI